MRNRHFPWLVLGTLSACVGSGRALATTVDFDDVSTGTNISNHYAGVTFGCINGTVASMNLCSGNSGGSFGAGSAFAVAGPSNPPSSPNVIGFGGGTMSDYFIDSRSGYLTAAFATPVRSVSIGALGTTPAEYTGLSDGPFLDAFGKNGQFLGAVWYDKSKLGTWQTLSITDATADIYYVAFSSQYSSGKSALYGSFDNLVATVPEPETYAMLFAGLGMLAGAARRRRQVG